MEHPARHLLHHIQFFDAIPRHVREQLQEEAEVRLRNVAPDEKIHELLDQDHGSCFMRDPRVASIVAGALEHFDGTRYELLAWCVMPNHVHVVTTLTAGEQIDKVIHSWKSFSSKQSNKVLNRTGSFWQEDYFDHTIRDSRELHNTIEYVMNNPAKAGLQNWPFVRMYPERIPV